MYIDLTCTYFISLKLVIVHDTGEWTFTIEVFNIKRAFHEYITKLPFVLYSTHTTMFGIERQTILFLECPYRTKHLRHHHATGVNTSMQPMMYQ